MIIRYQCKTTLKGRNDYRNELSSEKLEPRMHTMMKKKEKTKMDSHESKWISLHNGQASIASKKVLSSDNDVTEIHVYK